jgi:acyl-CoA reductase-like NAD-dependent aldehyde dehydrogenase
MDDKTEQMIETQRADLYVCDAAVDMLEANLALQEMSPVERQELLRENWQEMREELNRIYLLAEALESALAEAGALLCEEHGLIA